MKHYVSSLLATLILLLLWHVASIFLQQPFLPTPLSSCQAFVKMFLEGGLVASFMISFIRVGLSTLIAVFLAVPMAVWMGRCSRADRLFSPFVTVLYPLPKVVFLPIFVVLLGLGNLPKILLITLIIFFQILVVVRDSVRAIPQESLLAMQTLSLKKRDVFVHLIGPWLLPDLLTSLRVSSGTAIAVLFFAETFAAFDGLGYLILDGMERRDYADMYAAVMALSLLGILFYRIFYVLEKRCCRWKRQHD